jgi:hypothetical protein
MFTLPFDVGTALYDKRIEPFTGEKVYVEKTRGTGRGSGPCCSL